MKKKITAICLLAALLLALLPGQALAANVVASGPCGTNLTWTLDAAGVLTVSGTGAMKHFSKTSAPWYANRTAIRSLVIDSGVTSIGEYAFNGCTQLTTADLADTVEKIYGYSFYGCSRLQSINIPAAVNRIRYYTFSGCSALTGITLPEGVTAIDDYAFYKCSSLTEIRIPQSVKSIGFAAFEGCTKLAAAPLPAGLTSLGHRAFRGCYRLQEITIPAGVSRVYSYTFENCYVLKSVTLNAGLTEIDDYAFCNCSSLSEITIPESVRTVGNNAFADCTSLITASLSGNTGVIEEYTFSGCINLRTVTVPAGVHTIGASAFAGCGRLEAIWFRGEAPTVDATAFGQLAAKIYYPVNVESWTAEAMAQFSGSPTWIPYESDVSVYRGNDTNNYPVKDGYVFAGWYYDEAFTQPLGKDVTEGFAYPKFVAQDVLSVKWQVSALTNADTPSTTLRLVTTVDSLDYSTVGFKFRFGEGEEKIRTSTTVYSQIKSNAEGVVFNYEPTVFHETSRYFLTRTVTGIPAGAHDTQWTVTPFWITLDGTEVTGVTRTFQISDFYNR